MTTEQKLREEVTALQHRHANLLYSDPANLTVGELRRLIAALSLPEQQAPQRWLRPTTYRERFSEAVALLCGTPAPKEMIDGWLNNEDERLQVFAIDHAPAWAQGIVLLEAARLLAETPTEGVAHEAAPEAAKPVTEQTVPEDTVSNRHMIVENPGSAIAIMQDQQRQIEALKASLLAADSKAGEEPYAYAVYFPDQQREELVHYMFYLLEDMTNYEHVVTNLYTRPQQQAKPLTDQEIRIEYMRQLQTMNEKDGTVIRPPGFTEGIKFAERVHSIGKDQS